MSTDAQSTSPSLAEEVFRAIAKRYGQRADDIARFAGAKYSFEEWLNWEAFAACSTVNEWEARPKPSYCTLGVEDCKDYGDLLVTNGSEAVLVEIGLVHDGTGNKWRAKLAWDVEKLARPMSAISPLHVIVLASVADIENADNWQRWLAKVQCWSRPTSLTASVVLPPHGAMVIRGWTS
jgi:hypothetical protein